MNHTQGNPPNGRKCIICGTQLYWDAISDFCDNCQTVDERNLRKCPKCDIELIPDRDAVIFGTDKWDEHTFKFPCEHFENARICIG